MIAPKVAGAVKIFCPPLHDLRASFGSSLSEFY
jgi:hypothetical protein